MRLNRFDLNQLVCLEALLTECSVSRAAARIHLSQSAVSTVLAQLRAHFGDALLVRSGRGLVLTPFARDLIQPVKELLVRAHALTALSPERAPADVDRDLTIAASDYTMAAFMADAIRRANQRMPNLRFDILPLSEQSAGLMNRGEIDLMLAGQALVVGRPPNATVCADNYACLVSADHDLPDQAMTVDSYFARRHVVVRYFESQLTFADEDALRRRGLRRPRQIAVWSHALVPQLISGTSMIATIPQRIAQQFSTRWPLKIYPFPFATEPMHVFAYWHPSREHDPVLKHVMSLVSDVLAKPSNSGLP